MRKQLTILVLALGIMMSFGVNAQQKIGHINADELLQMMPETKAAQTQLEAYGKQLEKELEEMANELDRKYKSFVDNQAVLTTLAKQSKQQELQQLQQRIQQYEQDAQRDLQNKQVELLTPIIEKATKAVQEVAKENGYAYILDSSQSKAVIISQNDATDIMKLVKKKLAIVE